MIIKERVILIGANFDKQNYFLESMLELASLADALNYEVVNSYSQNIKENLCEFIKSRKI